MHYAEIGTKGGNRKMFEKRLMANLDHAATGLGLGPFHRQPGRVAADVTDPAKVEDALERLALIPGIAWLAPAVVTEPDIDAITKVAVDMAVAHPDSVFRVQTRRTFKQFPMDSLAVNRHVGAAIVQATGRSVSLGNPDYTYLVEIDKRRASVVSDRREGFGGLPVGSEGTLVALLSGGLDSPVAAFAMMRRGCRIRLLHFLNRSLGKNRVVEKIRDLADRLSYFHGPIDLTVVPFDDLQREIVMVVPDKYRMIVYRRAMFRIAELVRREAKALGFVTGDSVGQVASQTLENLRVIHEASDFPVYSPLAGTSKLEIVNLSKAIGTYEISIRPHDDCCSFMVAKHPATRARLGEIRGVEKFDMDAGALAAFEGRETIRFDPRPGPKGETS
ncbi:MAG: tRNA uracil 4-sulfurtransferase ThiI [Planctomycetota bacterium]